MLLIIKKGPVVKQNLGLISSLTALEIKKYFFEYK